MTHKELHEKVMTCNYKYDPNDKYQNMNFINSPSLKWMKVGICLLCLSPYILGLYYYITIPN